MRRAVLLLALFGAVPAMGQHLGVHGSLWEIQEEDGVAFLKRKVGDLVKDGTVEQMRADSTAKIKDAIVHQKPVPGYSVAATNQTRFFDPTVVLDKSVVNSDGRVIYPAGTKVNPLQYGGLSKRYVFIDGRIPAQIDFAVSEKAKYPTDSVILIAGDWVAVSKKIGTQAYYDQSGALTRRFKLNKVPSIVSQDGLRIKIEESAL